MNKILIFHSFLPPNAPKDELDVLDEVDFFYSIFEKQGKETLVSPFYNDLDKNSELINSFKPDLIVNLVETINGDGRLIHIAPSLFDYHGIPYTGGTSESIYVTSNKILAKELFKANNINSAKFVTAENIDKIDFESSDKFLVKSVWEHASVGIDEHSLKLFSNKSELKSIFAEHKKNGKLFFAENYIDGREFNISMIAGKVMPFAEIKFIDFPVDKIKVVGYRSKWDEDSFEYKNTVRSFDFDNADNKLLAKLEDLCIECWEKFKLKGYARVDFRVDKNDNPFVLEINVNPCISADSGFVAACKRYGYTEEQIVNLIIEDSI
ncbi:MAG: hypothetical protein A2033_00525 [Bacteroidetes bacterium GWA2_31_9]|nr:MAG: hypothetical protein A2033_00525 [Bacteroidetes bacterium GWA2_31_9]